MLERLRTKGRKEKAFPTVKLLLGAAGLLLFIVGVKRSYRMGPEVGTIRDDEAPAEPPSTPPQGS